MDEAVIDDLKQFIEATVSQQFAGAATQDGLKGLATKEDLKQLATKEDLVALDKKLTRQIDDLQTAVTATVIPYADTIDEQVRDHEQRLVKLETKPA